MDTRDLRCPELAAAVARQDLIASLDILDRLPRAVGHRDLRTCDQALIRIANGTDVAVFLSQELEESVLGVVGVLVLVDEDVTERLLPLLASLLEPLEHVDGQHQEVVEVDGVRGEETALVELVRIRHGLVVERLHLRGVGVRVDEPVLRVRDLVVDAARREALRVALELLQALLHEANLVGLVVDREVRAVAEPLRLSAQDASAGGVEGKDPEAASARPQEVPQALAHLAGSLVREGNGEDLVRLRTDGVDQVRDAVRKDARLSGARAGDHEQRPFGRQHRLALSGIQVGEVLLGRGDGHAPMLATGLYGLFRTRLRASRGPPMGPKARPERAWLA